MPTRDLKVTITREGKIVFDMSGFSQEEIRLAREMAEETLGRVTAEGNPGDPPPPGRARTHADDDEERLRHRR